MVSLYLGFHYLVKVYWSYSDDIINHKLTITLFVGVIAVLHFSTNFLLESFTIRSHEV